MYIYLIRVPRQPRLHILEGAHLGRERCSEFNFGQALAQTPKHCHELRDLAPEKAFDFGELALERKHKILFKVGKVVGITGTVAQFPPCPTVCIRCWEIVVRVPIFSQRLDIFEQLLQTLVVEIVAPVILVLRRNLCAAMSAPQCQRAHRSTFTHLSKSNFKCEDTQ